MSAQDEAATTAPAAATAAVPAAAPTSRVPALPRGVAYARVWTAKAEPVAPAEITDALYGRGFAAGVTDAGATRPALSEAGLAEAAFPVGGEGLRFVSLASSKGNGCLVRVEPSSAADLPDDYLARRTVPHPRLVYVLEAGGPSNSDRALCENIAEVLFLLADGLVEIGGLGVKGNRPLVHNRTWLGKIKASA